MTERSPSSTEPMRSRFDFESLSQKTYTSEDIRAYLKDHRAHNEAAFEEIDKEISSSNGFYGYRMAAAGSIGDLIAGTYSSLKVSGVLNETEAASARSRCGYAMHVNDLLKMGPKAIQSEAADEAILNILGFGRIVPKLLTASLEHRSDVLVKDIKRFHTDLGSEWAYPTDDFESKLRAQGDKTTVLKQHEEFLEHNKKQNEDVVDSFEFQKNNSIKDVESKIDSTKESISKLEAQSYRPGSSSERTRLENLSKHKEELKSLEQDLDTAKDLPDTADVVRAKDMLSRINTQEEHVELGRDRADYAKTTGRLNSLDSGVGMVRLGLHFKDFSEENITDPSLGDATLMTFGVSSLLGLPQMMEDVIGTKSSSKLAKGSNFFSGILGTAAGSMAIGDYAKALEDPNLTETQKKFIYAEIGLQATAVGLSALEGGLSVALSAVKAGSMASKVLGKAVPAVGVLAAVVGAINPGQFAAFDQQEEQIKTVRAINDHSSDFMADVLEDKLDLQKDIYIANTVIDVAVSIGVAIASATAASGIGAVVGFLISGLAAIISSIIESIIMEQLREEYRQKMLTDEDGNAQTYQDYANTSFDKQQKILKEKHEDFFQKLIEKGGYDSVSAVSGAWLTGTDKWMFAFTQRGEELNRTAKSYHEEYTQDKEWVDHSSGIQQGNTVILPELGDGSKRYVYSMSPMSLNFHTWTKSDGGHVNMNYKHSDVKGWTFRDQGDVDTVFNLDKVISEFVDISGYKRQTGTRMSLGGKGARVYSVFSTFSQNVYIDIDLKINAGGGDDVVLFSDVETIADGGDGKDVASYTSLGIADMTRGLTVSASANGALHVQKHFAAGSEYYTEQVEKTKDGYYIFESKQIVLETRTNTEVKKDTFTNFEVLQTTDLADEVDLSDGETSLRTLSTLSGDDTIVMGDHLANVIAGAGNDKVTVGTAAKQIFMEGGDDIVDLTSIDFSHYQLDPEDLTDDLTPEEVTERVTMISGGDGDDTVVISNEMLRHMTARYFEDTAAISAALELTNGYIDIDQTLNVSMDRLLLRDFEWVRFNAKDYKLPASFAPEQNDLYGASVATYKGVGQLNFSELREKAREYAASDIGEGSSRMGDEKLYHRKGYIYLNEGQDFNYLMLTTGVYSTYINGELIDYSNGYRGPRNTEDLTPFQSLMLTFGLLHYVEYTAEETGYHRIDSYYQRDINSPLSNHFFADSINGSPDNWFPEGLVDSKNAEFFSFKTRALNTVVKGTESFYFRNDDNLDNIYYMAEYRDIVNVSIGHSESKAPGHQYQEGVIYDSKLKLWSNGKGSEISIKPLIPYAFAHEQKGKIFLEAGKEYFFEIPQFKNENRTYATLEVNNEIVTIHNGYRYNEVSKYSVEADGLYDFRAVLIHGTSVFSRIPPEYDDYGHYTLGYRTSEDDSFKPFVHGNDIQDTGEINTEGFQLDAVAQSYGEIKETGVLYNAGLTTSFSTRRVNIQSKYLKNSFLNSLQGEFNKYSGYTALDNKHKLEGVIQAAKSKEYMHSYTGRFYVEQGQLYEFREAKSPDISALYLNGNYVFRDDSEHQQEQGIYKADKTGWVSFEYYVHNTKGTNTDTYKLTHRMNGKGSWQNIKMEAEHYAAKGLVDAFIVFTRNSEKTIHEVEDGERLKGNTAKGTEIYLEGKIFLEAGETYYFDTETTNGVTLSIDGTDISHSEGVFSYEATETRHHTLVYTEDSKGNYDLRFKQHGDRDFIPMAGQEAITDDPSINVDFSAKDIEHKVVLIGSEYDDKMEGSDFDDIISGDTGRDVIEGGKGNDVLSGWDGGDRFVFGADSGHDLISETLYVEDQFKFDKFEFNNLNFDDSNSYDLIIRDDDFVLLTYEDNNLDTSVTWVDFMNDERRLSSMDIFTMIDESGNEIFISQDTASAQLSSTFDNLSQDIQQDYLANAVV